MSRSSVSRSEPKASMIKASNIRIWIHDKDIDKLMWVVLEGQGHKLRNEVSKNTKVKRFLEYVPHLMNLIKSIHAAVVENNIKLLKTKTSPPVPLQILSSKDLNGLTALHKAAGLGRTKIVEYLIERWPNAIQETDSSGKTPLHYAAAVKNGEENFSLLVQAVESAVNGTGRSKSLFKKAINKKNDIEKSWLTVIPDAPRVPQEFPSHFSWDSITFSFLQAPIKFSQSELNLSSLTDENTAKVYENISKSATNLNNHESDQEGAFKNQEALDEAGEEIGSNDSAYDTNEVTNEHHMHEIDQENGEN